MKKERIKGYFCKSNPLLFDFFIKLLFLIMELYNLKNPISVNIRARTLNFFSNRSSRSEKFKYLDHKKVRVGG